MTGEARSRSCGSTIALSSARPDSIERLGLRISACAVGQASAAIFAREAPNMTGETLAATLEELRLWLRGQRASTLLPRLELLEPARPHAGRHEAILLPWKAALDALSNPAAQARPSNETRTIAMHGEREMATGAVTPQREPTEKEIRLVIAASSAGTIFEWYDFFIYGTLAGLIGAAFFPSDNETLEILLVWAGFAVGFGFRPLGAILFGFLGDRLGRKYTFLVTVTLMGIATAGVGLWCPAQPVSDLRHP